MKFSQTFSFCHVFTVCLALRLPYQPEDVELTNNRDQSEWLSSLLGSQEDFDKDEAEFLISQLKSSRTDLNSIQQRITEGWYNMTGRVLLQWAVAKSEEDALGKDLSNISDFGNAIPKMPRSWVKSITKLDDQKKYRYMFSGSFVHLNTHRKWFPSWAQEHFTNEDYFRATDYYLSQKYLPMGEFDHSLSDKGGFRPKGCGRNCAKTGFLFDGSYWENMKASKFVICPGGDAPYSFRFWETFLAGAIPVINSYEDDWNEEARPNIKWVNQIGYENLMTAGYPHSFDEKMEALAERNLKKFIRYQTWLEGDNDPVLDSKNGLKFE